MPDIYLPAITKIPSAVLDLPGSKSIANRVLLLAAVADGTSILHNVPDVAEDVVLMMEALKKLGVSITRLGTQDCHDELQHSGVSSYKIIGCNGVFPVKLASIFCGNSGTSIRFLTAMLSLMSGEYELTGIQRMKERPIHDLVAALKQVGADINYAENDGYPPLQTGVFRDNKAQTINISGKVSSQYLTGMLMAFPLLKRRVTIRIQDELISKPYIDITIALMQKFGCPVEINGNDYTINPITSLQAIEYTIEPDASSASYFLALGAIKGNITINNLNHASLQGDKNFAKTLSLMGANVDYQTNSINVKANNIKPININMERMPDVAMTLAVMALFADGPSTISGIKSWKVKETDRILAMFNELTKLGAKVAITDDSITITPPLQIISDVAIDTYNDHRMAMCFSLIAAYGIPVKINDYQCVGKTFANYFDLFKQICYI
jgi:3-phosphoshikimate 1-carboxyvinyltransferase